MESIQKRVGIFNFTDQTSGFIRSFTTVEFLLTQSDTSLEDWRASVRWGFMLASLMISVFVFFFFMVPNLLLLSKRIRDQKPALPSKVEWAYQGAQMYRRNDLPQP